MLTIHYADKKGAHWVRRFETSEQVWQFMQRIYCPAIVKDDSGREVGGVEEAPFGFWDETDKRRRWFRWVENDDPKKPDFASH